MSTIQLGFPILTIQDCALLPHTVYAQIQRRDSHRYFGFGNLIPVKSSPIEHIEMAESSAINGFMSVIRTCRRRKTSRKTFRKIFQTRVTETCLVGPSLWFLDSGFWTTIMISYLEDSNTITTLNQTQGRIVESAIMYHHFSNSHSGWRDLFHARWLRRYLSDGELILYGQLVALITRSRGGIVSRPHSQGVWCKNGTD
jgi:hypothetical protein